MWAITCYFNPMGYRRRLANFRTFRKHLPVPLVAVELAYGPDFELQPDDAEILLRLRSTAVMWQKERLLNLGLAALPAGCRKVAWLDCDVIVGRPDWPEPACLLLDEHPIIQLFRTAHYLPPRWTPDTARDVPAEFTRPSIAYELAGGAAPALCLGDLVDGLRGTSAAGFAWAARREILDRHGFYDACIVGGGTRAMVGAANRCFEQAARLYFMNERQREHYVAWTAHYGASLGTTTGFLDTDLFHLWHGEITARGTLTRHEGFRRFRFDPYSDIALDDHGVWRWNSDKPDMHEYLRRYFASRREDG